MPTEDPAQSPPPTPLEYRHPSLPSEGEPPSLIADALPMVGGIFGIMAAMGSIPVWMLGIYALCTLQDMPTRDRLPLLFSQTIPLLAIALTLSIAAFRWIRAAGWTNSTS